MNATAAPSRQLKPPSAMRAATASVAAPAIMRGAVLRRNSLHAALIVSISELWSAAALIDESLGRPKRGSADLDAPVDRRLHALPAYRNDLQQRRELAQPGQALLRGLPERAAREALRPLSRDHEALAVGIE